MELKGMTIDQAAAEFLARRGALKGLVQEFGSKDFGGLVGRLISIGEIGSAIYVTSKSIQTCLPILEGSGVSPRACAEIRAAVA